MQNSSKHNNANTTKNITDTDDTRMMQSGYGVRISVARQATRPPVGPPACPRGHPAACGAGVRPWACLPARLPAHG
eukprot:10458759-Alexandrium_andersonii.AAC.1